MDLVSLNICDFVTVKNVWEYYFNQYNVSGNTMFKDLIEEEPS